jgi:hypothetical protein
LRGWSGLGLLLFGLFGLLGGSVIVPKIKCGSKTDWVVSGFCPDYKVRYGTFVACNREYRLRDKGKTIFDHLLQGRPVLVPR